MNPDFMCHAMLPPAYYQQYYMNYLIQHQQMLQYMLSQQQQATTTFSQCKQESLDVPCNSVLKQQIESSTNTHCIQNNQLTEGDQGGQEKSQVDEEDSSSRVNGHWTKQEHEMYLDFVRNYESTLKSKYDKKSKKIFKLMSQFIPTRTATQCRSHHQKFNPLAKGKKKNKQSFRQPPTVLVSQS